MPLLVLVAHFIIANYIVLHIWMNLKVIMDLCFVQ